MARHQTETQDIAQTKVKTVTNEQSTEEARRIFQPDSDIVQVMDVDDDYAKSLAFMEDELIVRIHKTSNKNEDDPVLAGVNGIPVSIPRGMPVKVKRKFVNAIIGSSLMEIDTPEFTNNEGAQERRIVQRSGERYPLFVEYDPHPREGRMWLEQAIRNGGA